MEFTKGMTVRMGETFVFVTDIGWDTFSGWVIAGRYTGEYRNDYVTKNFHPFDLQSAIEEALKKEKAAELPLSYDYLHTGACDKCGKYPFVQGCKTESGSYHASQFCHCDNNSALVDNIHTSPDLIK